jgi:hypothetical protein
MFNLFFASVLTLVFVLGWRSREKGSVRKELERSSTTSSGFPSRSAREVLATPTGLNHDSSKVPSGNERRIRSLYRGLPLFFEPNAGQVGNDAAGNVKFVSRGPGYTIFLTSDGAVLALMKPSAPVKAQKTSGAVLRMRLLGSNTSAPAAGTEELGGKSNYFFASDPANWHTSVAN